MLDPGTRLGPYELQTTLGSGGSGDVYRARDTRLDRTVAIKVLAPQGPGAEGVRERIEREARAISRLSHPHICTLYDIGETGLPGQGPEPVAYLVMELVEGETLAAALARGPLPISQALTYAQQTAAALAAAHRAGIVHGDLKPGNIMLARGGVKLLDFGLARPRVTAVRPEWADAVTQATAITDAGTVVGTLQYLAPEQVEGRPADERSDLFACGAVMYEMVTGRRAFGGDSPAQVIAAILREETPLAGRVRPDVPEPFERVIAACLAKDPEARWQSAADLARELKWMIDTPAISGIAATRTSRWPWVVAAVLGIVLAAVLATAWRRTETPAEPLMRTSLMLPRGLRFPIPGTSGGVGRIALSPDGRRLVFVAIDENGEQALWLRSLDGLMSTRLAGTDGASSPFWAPDSQTVAFFAQGQLKTLDTRGGMPTVIASPAYNATGAWLGDTILFSANANGPISRVSAGGGQVTPVTKIDTSESELLHRNPFPLPDGKHFLFVAVARRAGNTTAARGIFAGSLDDPDDVRVVIDGGTSAKYYGGYLIFLRENVLLAQPFDPKTMTRSGEARPIAEQVELTAAGSASFNLSNAGTLVYQSSSDEGSQLTWVDRDGHRLGTVGEPAQYGDVELSPDGRQVAVTMLDPLATTRDVWVVDVARGVRTRLTSHPSEDLAPIWMTDGATVVFSSNRGGHWDLYRKSANGVGNEEVLFGDTTEKYAATAASGGRLLYWTFGGGNPGLSLLTPGNPPARTTFIGSPANQASISPDERWVAYTSSESGRPEIYIVSYPAASRRLQLSTAGGNFARWRRDGRELFYISRDNRLMSVSLTPHDGDVEVSAPRPLFEIQPVGRGYNYAPSPDGQRFLVNTLLEQGLPPSITLLQHWQRALSQ